MKLSTPRNISIYLLPLLAMLMIIAVALPALAAPAVKAQKSFATPEEAASALAAAIKSGNTREIRTILGPGSDKIISSGDPVADKSERERFVTRYEEKNSIAGSDTGKAILSVGSEDFPFPIPVVKKGTVWRFDAKAGKEEILNRRIGRNELAVIEVLHAYVDAQREYAATDRDGNGTTEFAQKVRSTPGKKDGLYWAAKEGEKESPLGPLAAKAAREGYEKKNTALHGYYYRILKAQGKDAEGGAFDYLVNGKMILGFAMVAYPAQYGSSGIMTFIVNQNGIVYQKDLGKNTAKTAAAMKRYNPDKSWKKVE
jgi:hypothetical protein